MFWCFPCHASVHPPNRQMSCKALRTPVLCSHCWLVQEEIVEDPDNEFDTDVDSKHGDGPRVINVGIPGPGAHVPLWKRAWRDKILPAVARFKPDIIFISAGFDAHRKDDINFRSDCCLLRRSFGHLPVPHQGLAGGVCLADVSETWKRLALPK